MDIILLKILCTVVLFIVMTTCGLIPIIAVWKSRSANFKEITSKLISICNCLAGGVFMGMCFLGLFPYVREKLQDVLDSADVKISFPLTEFVVVIGFFIFLTVEQLVIIFRTKTESGESVSKKVSLNMSEVEESDLAEEEKKCEDESHARLLGEATSDSDLCFIPKSRDDNFSAIIKPEKQTLSQIKLISESQASVKGSLKRPYSGHNHGDFVYTFQKDSGMRNIIFIFAMSVHSLFEGMTLGLQTDTVKVLHLFLAILLHESLVIFALGVNVAKFNFGLGSSIKCIILVTISIPIGIVFGMLCEATPGLFGKIVSALLQGLSAGIFIHVTFMELIPEEFFSSTNRLCKVFFFFIGFMCIAIVTFTLGKHH